jgi:hydroxymethylglutaryl-CoA lyase
MIRIIESPREAMQGFSHVIPTQEKVRYINHLLRAGFDTVEIGSIVSPKVIPQMADSLEVLKQLDLSEITTNRMFLAVNERGAKLLAQMDEITHISYPFSFASAFLKRNLNTTPEESLDTVKAITELCATTEKQAVTYISMAFGNLDGDPWSVDLLFEWVGKLHHAGAGIIVLSNVAMEIDAAMISDVYSRLIPAFAHVEFGLHLHTANEGWKEKVNAAFHAGCRRFDGVISGLGGCPMSGTEMLGNLKTENLVEFAETMKIPVGIDQKKMNMASGLAMEVFQNIEY